MPWIDKPRLFFGMTPFLLFAFSRLVHIARFLPCGVDALALEFAQTARLPLRPTLNKSPCGYVEPGRQFFRQRLADLAASAEGTILSTTL